jgi:hypothetical protein
MKCITKLTRKDLRRNPVWEFCNDLESDSGSETYIRPVTDLPVNDLGNRIVGTKVRLANGTLLDAFLSNIDLESHTNTEHFAALSVFRKDGKLFHLSRYFDSDAVTHGPAACATFLSLAVHEVFPITYDISDVAIGVPASVRRKIPEEPLRRLSSDELMRMAIGGF